MTPDLQITGPYDRLVRLKKLERQERALRKALKSATDHTQTCLSPHGVRLLEDELYRTVRQIAYLKSLKFT